MTDLTKHIDASARTLGLLGLLGAACGPSVAQETDSSDGTGTGTGTGNDTDPTTGATDTVDPTDPTDPTSPTSSTTEPPPECVEDSDCPTYNPCGSSCNSGVCENNYGCCGGYYELDAPGTDPKDWRCQPPYECYIDAHCSTGYECEFGECIPLPPTLLPLCPPAELDVSAWNLGATPSAFLLADFDGDLDLDLAAAQPGVAQIEVALGDGLGGFVIAGAFGVGAPVDTVALAAGDLDNDGDLDLDAVRDEQPVGGMVLLLNQAGVFTPGPLLATASGAREVDIADLDNDGDLDVLVSNFALPSLHLGDGKGGLGEPAAPLGVDAAIGSPTLLTDVTADGILDILTPVTLGTEVRLWTGTPGGEFLASLVLDTVIGPNPALLGGDLDPLSLPELVTVNWPLVDQGIVQVFAGIGPNDWSNEPTVHTTASPLLAVGLTEADATPGLDLVAATGVASVVVLVGDNAGGFSCERVLPVSAPTSPMLVAVGDVDGDGVPDIVAGDAASPAVTVLRQ